MCVCEQIFLHSYLMYVLYYYSGSICSMETMTFCTCISVSWWSKPALLLTDRRSTLNIIQPALSFARRELQASLYGNVTCSLLFCEKMLRVRFLNAGLSIPHDWNSRSALLTTFWHWKYWPLCILTFSLYRGCWCGLWVLAMISLHSEQNKWQ